MTTGKLWPSKANVIVPYKAVTKRTKDVTLTVKLNTTYNGSTEVTSPTYVFKRGYAYADSAGKWRLNFSVTATFSSATFTSYSLDITGVTFPYANGDQGATSMGGAFFATSDIAGRIYGFCLSTTTSIMYLSGDVALASEPTWASANMEAFSDISVYIEPASAGVSGIVNNLAGNTKGTPILGKTDGVAVAAGYVGEIKELGGAGTGGVISSNEVTDSNLGALALGAGIWDIQLAIVFGFNSTVGLETLSGFIGTASGNNTTNRELKTLAVNRFANGGIAIGNDYAINTPTYRVNLSSATNYYAKSYAYYSGGTVSATAYMRATRIA